MASRRGGGLGRVGRARVRQREDLGAPGVVMAEGLYLVGRDDDHRVARPVDARQVLRDAAVIVAGVDWVEV